MTSNAKKLERIVEAVRSPHDQRFGLSHDLKAARRLATAYEKATARVSELEAALAAKAERPDKPMVWCETHQHEHIASIPRFTFQCKSCGFGQWYKPQAEKHEAECPGHETYEVEHVTRPLSAEPVTIDREAVLAQAAATAISMSENEADGYYGQACHEVAAAIRTLAAQPVTGSPIQTYKPEPLTGMLCGATKGNLLCGNPPAHEGKHSWEVN